MAALQFHVQDQPDSQSSSSRLGGQSRLPWRRGAWSQAIAWVSRSSTAFIGRQDLDRVAEPAAWIGQRVLTVEHDYGTYGGQCKSGIRRLLACTLRLTVPFATNADRTLALGGDMLPRGRRCARVPVPRSLRCRPRAADAASRPIAARDRGAPRIGMVIRRAPDSVEHRRAGWSWACDRGRLTVGGFPEQVGA